MNYIINENICLKNVSICDRYDTGEAEALNVESKNIVVINGKKYIPRYTCDNVRRKELPSIRLYKSGEIKSIDLENQIEVEIGNYNFNAEKVIFYKNGNIKRLFPLNGKINAFYTEEDEYKISPIYNLNFKFTNFSGKIISAQFYKSGFIKSITLWPKDNALILHNGKYIKCKTGFSLYENGNLKSIEPMVPIIIDTPIGKIEAYDDKSIGVTGENNSLKFNIDGSIRSLITSTNVIRVVNSKKYFKLYSPKKSIFMGYSDILNFETVKVEFERDKVIINSDNIYNINEYRFEISYYGEKSLYF